MLYVLNLPFSAINTFYRKTRPANVSLSAKKRNKMLKQIRRQLNEKSKMEGIFFV